MTELAVSDRQNVQPITAYLCCSNANEAIEFYVNAFGAEKTSTHMEMPDGTVMHSELRLNGHLLMLSDEFPEMNVVSPDTIGNSPVALMLEVADADAVFTKALEFGATELAPMTDHFYGKRSGQILDPAGHRWAISHHIQDLTAEELDVKAQEFAAEMEG